MSISRKILSVFLAFFLIFGSVTVIASASDEINDAERCSISICSSFENFITKVKNFFADFIEKIKNLFNFDADSCDLRKYSEASFEIPGLDEDFVPQGVCYVESLDAFAVSGYVKNEVSRIYLVYDDGITKKIYLDSFDLHAGGIASNGTDLWVSAGGNEMKGGHIYHMSTDALRDADDGDTVAFDGRFGVYSRASALYCSDDTLWVAEFYEKKDYPVNESHYYGKNHAWASGYKLPLNVDYTAEESPVPDVVLSVPDKVQGMCITDSGDVVFSTSYGRKNNSYIYVFDDYLNWDKSSVNINSADVDMYITTKNHRIIKSKMPTLMEGADYYKGKMYVIFESGAKTYSNAKEIIKTAWQTDIDRAVKNVK